MSTCYPGTNIMRNRGAQSLHYVFYLVSLTIGITQCYIYLPVEMQVVSMQGPPTFIRVSQALTQKPTKSSKGVHKDVREWQAQPSFLFNLWNNSGKLLAVTLHPPIKIKLWVNWYKFRGTNLNNIFGGNVDIVCQRSEDGNLQKVMAALHYQLLRSQQKI